MKKYIATFAAVAMIAAVATVNAQPKGGAQPKAGLVQILTQNKADLGVTDDQTAQVTKIFSDAKTAASDASLSKEQKEEIMKKAKTDAMAVLNDDQQAKVKALMTQPQGGSKEGQAKAGEKGKGGQAKKGGEHKAKGGDGEGGGGDE